MKKILAAALLALLWVAPALAEQGPYVSAAAGYGSVDDAGRFTYNRVVFRDALGFGGGVPWGVAIGYRFDDNRVEGSLGYQTNKWDAVTSASIASLDIKTKTRTLLVNAYHDFKLRTPGVTPYVTLGFGGVNEKVSVAGVDSADSSNVFLWQAGIGAGIKATDQVIVDLGYRYYSAAECTVESPASGFSAVNYSLSGHKLLAGVRVNF